MKKSAQLFQRGFTLIELIIVISILGILAVGILALINPVEQINKTKDTGRLNDAKEVLDAIDRYTTANSNCTPWDTAPNCGVTNLGVAAVSLNGAAWWTKLSGELKSTFTTRDSYTKSEIYVVQTAVANPPSVCYTPQSKSVRSGGTSLDVTTFSGAANTCGNTAYAAGQQGCMVCLPQ